LKLNNLIYCLLFLFSVQTWASEPDSTINTDGDYYMFPIRPNEVNTLAGNMGELRASHFHAGLDIRTGGRIGLPVHAAADGYVSRVAVKSGGYGKAIYITHTNGETTVYAHLNKFNGAIANHVREHQYAQRNPYLNKYFKKDVFKVQKGEVIASSGNSGSSAGPHLHFEIRDKDQQILNPLKYNFEEIRDTTPPIFKSIAITPKDIDARINGAFRRVTFDAHKIKENYILKDTARLFGKVGFELFGYDKLNDAHYKCGISRIIFEIDDEMIFDQKIDTINFSSQRNILTHYNYPAYISSGKKYHKLYLDDGNQLPFYTTNETKGVLSLKKAGLRNATIKIYDVLGNQSILKFTIEVNSSPDKVVSNFTSVENITLLENILIINQPSEVSVSVRVNDQEKQLTPSYGNHDTNYFLWDLRNGIPQAIANESGDLSFEPSTMVLPGRGYSYYSDEIDVTFGKSALFDTLYFSTSYANNIETSKEEFTLGNPSISALKNSIYVTLKSKEILPESDKSKTHVYKKSGSGSSLIGGEWNKDNISFKTRDFGIYTIRTDSIAPTIIPISLNEKFIQFKVKDNLSGINKFDVFVNNEWILMDYDYKTSMIKSDPSYPKALYGEVRVRVSDNAGNEQTLSTKLLN